VQRGFFLFVAFLFPYPIHSHTQRKHLSHFTIVIFTISAWGPRSVSTTCECFQRL